MLGASKATLRAAPVPPRWISVSQQRSRHGQVLEQITDPFSRVQRRSLVLHGAGWGRRSGLHCTPAVVEKPGQALGFPGAEAKLLAKGDRHTVNHIALQDNEADRRTADRHLDRKCHGDGIWLWSCGANLKTKKK